jgi:hypothetical protein
VEERFPVSDVVFHRSVIDGDVSGSGNGRTREPWPSLAQHAFLASIDRDTKLAVGRAYRARRQLGESHHPAHLAAVEAFRTAPPSASDAEAMQAAVLIVARAAQEAAGWLWKGI